MRSAALRVTVALAVLLAACHSYKPLTLPGPGSVVGKQVRVQFSTPRNVRMVRDGGGDTILVSVGALQGRAVAVSGDTLLVAPALITDGTGEHAAPAALRVGILPDPSIAVDVRDFDDARTAALAGGTVLIIYGVAVIVAVAALAAVY
jgi:hypothetical protein